MQDLRSQVICVSLCVELESYMCLLKIVQTPV